MRQTNRPSSIIEAKVPVDGRFFRFLRDCRGDTWLIKFGCARPDQSSDLLPTVLHLFNVVTNVVRLAVTGDRANCISTLFFRISHTINGTRVLIRDHYLTYHASLIGPLSIRRIKGSDINTLSQGRLDIEKFHSAKYLSDTCTSSSATKSFLARDIFNGQSFLLDESNTYFLIMTFLMGNSDFFDQLNACIS